MRDLLFTVIMICSVLVSPNALAGAPYEFMQDNSPLTEAELLKLTAKKDAIEAGMQNEAARVAEANQGIEAIHTAQQVNAEKQRQADLEDSKKNAAAEAKKALERDEADIDLYGSEDDLLPVGPVWAK